MPSIKLKVALMSIVFLSKICNDFVIMVYLHRFWEENERKGKMVVSSEKQ